MYHFLSVMLTCITFYTANAQFRTIILSNMLFKAMSTNLIDETTPPCIQTIHAGISNALFLFTLYILAKECILLVDHTVYTLKLIKNAIM